MTAAPPPPPAREVAALSPIRARALRRAEPSDLLYCVAVVAVAFLAVASGRRAAQHLSPEGAKSASALLDRLELPRVLPNASLVRDDGAPAKLWDVATEPRTIVSFYAPWCAPCQEELPMLVAGTTRHPARLAVVVGPDEDPAEVRKQLENIGLADLRYHVDVGRELENGGRVTALPTTFLIGRRGQVLDRVVGYAGYRLQMVIYKATTGETVPADAGS
jgi:thiol-disulfide isomerase/thioredoxin